jgi:hypothetical protein
MKADVAKILSTRTRAFAGERLSRDLFRIAQPGGTSFGERFEAR